MNLDPAVVRESKTRRFMPTAAERNLRATGVFGIVYEDRERRARPLMACYPGRFMSIRRLAPTFMTGSATRRRLAP